MFRFSLIRREDGQTMAEYGVVLAVITVALVGAFTLLSGEIGNAINGSLEGAARLGDLVIPAGLPRRKARLGPPAHDTYPERRRNDT